MHCKILPAQIQKPTQHVLLREYEPKEARRREKARPWKAAGFGGILARQQVGFSGNGLQGCRPARLNSFFLLTCRKETKL